MRLFQGITIMMMAMTVFYSCSIKEDRRECPCYLDVEMLRQAQEIFPSDKAWCGVWADGIENVGEHVFEPVIGSDGIYSCPVRKNPATAVVIANMNQRSGKVTVPTGEQMSCLYVARKDADCTGELSHVIFDSFGKQYVIVNFRLDEEAQPYKEDLRITLDGPYDGLSLPSMTAHRGAFNYSLGFDEKGEATLRIPPQGGPGLKIGIQLGKNPPAVTDLYRMMLDAGYNWKDESLKDFSTEISLNSITGVIEFVDWNIIQLEDQKY